MEVEEEILARVVRVATVADRKITNISLIDSFIKESIKYRV